MRRRIAGVVAAVSALVALAFVIPLGVLVRQTAEDRAIDRARTDAAAVVPMVVAGASPGELANAVAATTAGAEGRMTVVTGDGSRVGPATDSAEFEDALLTGRSSVSDTDGGQQVVTAVVDDTGARAAIRVFVENAELRRGQWPAWGALLGVAALLVGLSVAVADRMARTIVRPTQLLAGAANALGDGDLEVRVEPDGPPELVELGDAFNELASRVRVMLDDERALVAELSHRLRTPLTALSMRIEGVEDPAMATALRRDVDRVTKVVDQLINEARGRPETRAALGCDAADVVAARVEFWAVLAQDQGRPWGFERAAGSAKVSVGRDELLAAVDVLIDNVFTHTDDGVGMRVWVRPLDDGMVGIGVADSGDGFEAAYLAEGSSGAESTGLGLSIAQRTAELAGGHIAMGRQDEWMVVELVLPTSNV